MTIYYFYERKYSSISEIRSMVDVWDSIEQYESKANYLNYETGNTYKSENIADKIIKEWVVDNQGVLIGSIGYLSGDLEELEKYRKKLLIEKL